MNVSLRDLLRTLPVGGRAPEPAGGDGAFPNDPLALLESWMRSAITAGVLAPHAATLSTVDTDSGVDARTLIVKDIDPEGVWFATRSDGGKAAQIAIDDRAAMTLHWREQSRQIRIRGRVRFADSTASTADFAARPPHSRATAMVGVQSAVMPDDVDYAAEFAAALERATETPLAGADTWRAAVLIPDAVEFWWSTPDSGPRRIEYRRHEDGVWEHHRLWP